MAGKATYLPSSHTALSQHASGRLGDEQSVTLQRQTLWILGISLQRLYKWQRRFYILEDEVYCLIASPSYEDM